MFQLENEQVQMNRNNNNFDLCAEINSQGPNRDSMNTKQKQHTDKNKQEKAKSTLSNVNTNC
jgi:hypothetical protein